MTPARTLRLTIPGEPKGKGRPRTTRHGHVYTPDETIRAEKHIQAVWMEAGEPRLPDCALAAEIHLLHARPKVHFKKDGSLGVVGERVPVPVRKPDVDNALKLVLDALNGLAYRDDAQISDARIVRRWASTVPSTTVMIREAA